MKRQHLRRVRKPNDLRCKACWEAKVPFAISVVLCQGCLERAHRAGVTVEVRKRSGDRAGNPTEPFVVELPITDEEARDLGWGNGVEPPPP